MTVSQAYVSGFCKAAEAMGVDPVALCKRAAPVSLLGAVGRGFRRYGSLLRGGRVAELQSRADKFDGMASRYAAKGFAADAARRVPAAGARGGLAGPSPYNVAQRAQYQADRARSMLAAERNAVDNAQVATMYGTLGLGGLGYHYLSSGDPGVGQDAT